MFLIEPAGGAGGTTEIILPAGWRALTQAGALPPASRRISYMLAASIPSTAQAGRYPIVLVVRHGAVAVQSRAWAIIPVRRSLDLSLVTAPQTIVAGSMIQGLFRLVNTGNSPTRASVVLSSPTLSRRDSLLVDLEPGASRDIPVNLKTDGRQRTLLQPIIHAAARSVEAKGIIASSSFRVLVAPAEAFAAAPFHTISSRARLIGTSGRGAGAGTELAGSGTLRDGWSTRFDYLARRMNGYGARFGDRDEYRLALSAPNYSVVVGNDVYRLSSLSESGRYAPGAKASVKSNGWTLGGFFNHDPAQAKKPEQRALFLNRDFANGNVLLVNFLDKTGPGGGSMLATRTSIRTIPFVTIDAELGHAINSRPAEAWLVSAHGQAERFSYSIFRQKTDRDYPGSTRGTESANVLLNATPARRLRVRASFSDHRLSPGQTGPLERQARHWHYMTGVTLDDRYALEYTRNGRDDGSFSSQPRRNERLLIARVSAAVSGAFLNASGAVGQARGGGAAGSAGSEQPLARFAASGSLRKGRSLSLSANVEALRGGTLFLPGQRSEVRGGASATVVTRSGSRFSVSGYASRRQMRKETVTGDRLPSRDGTLDLSWDQKLASGHSISVRARFHRSRVFTSAEEDAVRVEYTIPFGVPVARSQSKGRVSGRVYDAESGRPVRGAMIQLGSHLTITDAKGKFAFSTDSENPVIMNLAGTAATAGLIPLRDMPMTVEPRMGRTSTFEIPLTRAGGVDGRIRLFVSASPLDPRHAPVVTEDTLGLPRARLELTQGAEVRRTVSNSRGEFAFTDLRPGAWRLTIVGDDLPEFSYLEGDSAIVSVTPGQRARAEMRVLPRRRKITIVQVR
jgi:hypothetical protein